MTMIKMAIAYDFDDTLAQGNMQEYNFIPELGLTPKSFWSETKAYAKEHEMDEILAYMYLMIHEADHKKVPIRRENFHNFGKEIGLFPGVSDWFKRINAYAKNKNIKLEHFIISSGIREMIQGTPIAKNFKNIYASSFMFDQNGVARWPALAINFTTKTQYLFRINKGSFDVHDNTIINKFIPKDQRYILFENMIFIGDGETDVPCMRLVKDQGGYSIAVYRQNKRGAKAKAEKLVYDGRVSLIARADYSDGSDIDSAIKAIIDKIEAISRIC